MTIFRNRSIYHESMCFNIGFINATAAGYGTAAATTIPTASYSVIYAITGVATSFNGSRVYVGYE